MLGVLSTDSSQPVRADRNANNGCPGISLTTSDLVTAVVSELPFAVLDRLIIARIVRGFFIAVQLECEITHVGDRGYRSRSWWNRDWC